MLLTKRASFASAAIALAGLVSGCSAGSTVSQSTVGTTAEASIVSIGVTGAPASLDFTTTSGAAIPQALMGNVYEGLVRINQSGELEPLLAESWTLSEDARTYTFTLREGVFFNNGEAFTADSVKFSIERVLSDAWTNGLKAQMKAVETVEVLSPHQVAVTLSQPSNQWLWSMGTLVGAMMSPTGVDSETLATAPVGTGPYVVNKWAVGNSLSLKKREDYWGAAPQNSGVVFRYFGDAIALTNAVRSGNIDAAVGMQSPELMDSLQADPKLSVEVGTTNGEVLLSMNNQRAPFNDVRVRQAVMYGVDRQAVIDTTWEGYGIDTGGAPVPPTDPWFTKSDMYPYDPAKAKALMEEAGAVGTPITLSVPSFPYAQQASEILYSQLNDIGFEVTIEQTEFPAVWLAKVYKAKDYDMSIIAHVEPRDVATLFGNPEYYLGFDSPLVQSMLSEADVAPPAEYNEKMAAAINEIMVQAAADTLYNFPLIVVSREGVRGIPTNTVSDSLYLAGVSKQ